MEFDSVYGNYYEDFFFYFLSFRVSSFMFLCFCNARQHFVRRRPQRRCAVPVDRSTFPACVFIYQMGSSSSVGEACLVWCGDKDDAYPDPPVLGDEDATMSLTEDLVPRGEVRSGGSSANRVASINSSGSLDCCLPLVTWEYHCQAGRKKRLGCPYAAQEQLQRSFLRLSLSTTAIMLETNPNPPKYGITAVVAKRNYYVGIQSAKYAAC